MIVLRDELNRFSKKAINTSGNTSENPYKSLQTEIYEESKLTSYQLGDLYYNNALDLASDNNISKAAELLEKSLEYNDKNIEALNLLGIFYYMLCNFNKARVNWNNSLRYNNQSNRAGYYLESLNSDKFKSFIEYYNLSIKYIERFQYSDAIELLLEINKTNKDLIEPYALIGNSYYAIQQYDLGKKYFNKALAMDIDNIKYLKYLNRINGSAPVTTKTKIRDKDKHLNFKIAAAVSAMFIIIFALFFYRNYNKNIRELALELEKSKTENSKLKNELEKDKAENIFASNIENQDKETPADQGDASEEDKEDDANKEKANEKREDKNKQDQEANNNTLKFDGTEPEIFEAAMKDFKSEDYKKSIDKLKYLISKGTNEDLSAESTYFIAVLFEKEKDYDKAEEYYSSYINKYRERSYYDDSLYNYGLMLYENGDIEASKKVLNKLKKDEPKSEFVNSKVKAILGK